jgi:hypothetical protein
METNPEVERWFAERKQPLQESMRRVAELILGADPRMTAYLKYGTLTFAHEGDLAAFVQLDKKPVSLMFNRGARIPGAFPHLEGTGPTARFMRFADLAEVEARAAELSAIASAWCALQAQGSGEAPPAAKAKRAPAAKSTTKAKPAQKPKAAAKAQPAQKPKAAAKAKPARSPVQRRAR